MRIRAEDERDVAIIHRVNTAAFSTKCEADLVDQLRRAVDPFTSLIAEVRRDIVGHILFTPVCVTPHAGPTWHALALGPMAVLPSHQNRGIGSALVLAGLDECRRIGEMIVFVLGHPQFYPRFGFQPARPLGFACQWDVPDDVFLVAELSSGALQGRSGLVEYHALFESV